MAIVSDVEIRLRADIARLQQDMSAARRSVDTAMQGITRAAETARNALAGIAGGIGLAELARVSDQYAKFTAQLRLATESTREYAQAYADVKRISSAAQTDLAATGVLYARIANGTRDLGVSQQKVGQIVEATSLALKVSGATTEESASAILQLSQAFGAGALRGEEFNAVNEAAPRLMKAIADGLGVPVGALKNMATQGQLTAQVLADVLPKSLGKLRAEADQVQTIAGAFTLLKNNVMEFVGASTQSSGVVSVLTQAMATLANNLQLVGGAALTLAAVKLGTWLETVITSTVASVAANRELAASALVTAQANATATAQASLLANARLAEVRAATLAAAGEVQLALTTNGLVPAQASAAAAAEAHAAAMLSLGVAARGASVATTAVSGVIAALGGPIGVIITLLGLAATAWSVYQSRQEEANRKAQESTAQSTIEIVANLEKQNEKLRERIALAKQAGLEEVAKDNSPGTERLASILARINYLKAQGSKLDAGDQVELITQEGIYGDLLKAVQANKSAKKELDAVGAAPELIAVRERLTGVNKQYIADLKTLQDAYDKGKVTEKEYVSLVSQLATETWKSSDAGKAATKTAKDSEKQDKANAEAIKQRAQAQEFANKQEEMRLDFMRRTGQMDEETFITQRAAQELQVLATEKKALEDREALLQRHAGTAVDRAKLRTEIDAKSQASTLVQTKREQDLFELEQKRYRAAVANTADMIEAAQHESLTQRDATRDMQDEIDVLGLTSEQLAQVTAARLRDRAAALDRRAEIGIIQDVNVELRKQADELRKQADLGLTKSRVEEQQKFWGSIEQTAHDTFVSIADGGKDTWTRLRDSAKNIFFEWLYQQTLKKWLIEIQPTVAGGGLSSLMGTFTKDGMAGLFKAGEKIFDGFSEGLSKNLGGAVSKLGSLFGSETMSTAGENISASASAGGIAAAIVAGMMANNKFFSEGWRIDGQLNEIVKTQLASTFKGNFQGPAMAVMTASMGAFDKLMAKIGVNSKFASMISGSAVWTKMFGHQAPTIESQGIRGSLNATGFTGEAFANILEKGGWFRSDKHYTKGSALGADQDAAFGKTVTGIADSVRAFSQVLGAATSAIDGYSKDVNLTLTKDDEENKKLIASLFSGIGDDLATLVLPNIAKFSAEGETAATTLERLALDFKAVDIVLAEMRVDSMTAFKAVGAASIEARERLVALAGGVEALAAQTDFFTQNFLTAAEQIAPVQKRVTEGLAAIGYSGLATTEQFKVAVQTLINSGALATEEGAKAYATLLAMAPDFKKITDAAKVAADAAAEAAQVAADAAQAAADAAAQAAQAVVDTLRGTASAAFDALQRAIDGRKKELQTAFDKVMAGLQASIDAAGQRVSDLQNLSGMLKGSGLPGTTMDRASAQAQLATAIALARAGGVLPSAEQVQGILSALGGDTTDQFSTLADYQRDQLRTANSVEELSGLTDNQLSVAQQSLNALNRQKDIAQADYDVQVAQLDGILTAAQAQLDAINGVDNLVLAVVDAFAQFAASISAALGNSTIGGQATVTAETRIEALYESILGRVADAGGMKYYADLLRSGASIDNIGNDLRNSAEYQAAHPPVVVDTGVQYGTMAGTSTSQQMINTQMQTALDRTASAVEQLASQFNQVSGGGNSLLTEPANALG